jgi:hypothetical protein
VLRVALTQRGFWWERYPERLTAELEALERNGIRYERDPEAESQGVMRLRLWYPLSTGAELYLVATFPDNYPFFRFEVEAPDLDLPYHQHARAGNLCLLPRTTDLWHPSSDRLGDILRSQLERVLALGGQQVASPEISEQEEHQAEPYSDYYDYIPGAILLTDSSWSISQRAQYGDLHIGLETLSSPIRGAILEVTDEQGNIVAKTPEELARNYHFSIKARWARFNTPPSARLTAAEIYQSVRENDLRGIDLKESIQGGKIAIKGVLFPEEIRWRGVADRTGDGWLFVVRFEQERPSQKKRDRNRSLVASPENSYGLVRAGRAGRSDLSVRIPELAPLAQCCIAQFGLGCLGAPSSLEFARAGLGELRILDHDFVEPGSVVRWPIGLTAAGHLKVAKLLETISFNYPYTKVVGRNWKIGATYDPRRHESDILAEMLDGADLVYDSTAEYGVQLFLSSLAAERRIPYIGVQSTAGAWGGVVVRIRPNMTEGCWQCFQWKYGELIPKPAFDEKGDQVQPAGCADPTFTGANFDLMQVAMMGVRSAVSTLCGGQEAAYPEMDWDVAVLDLRDSSGQAIAPTWQLFTLNKDPRCETCGALAGI